MTSLAHRTRRIKEIPLLTLGIIKRFDLSARLDSVLTGSRLLVVLVLGLFLTAIEMIDHYQPGGSGLFEPQFWHRIPIYSLLVPGITWILLGRIERSRSVTKAIREIDCLNLLRVALTDATSWDGLLETIIQYPRLLMPVRAVALYVLSADGAQFDLSAYWSRTENKSRAISPAIPFGSCAGCLSTRDSTQADLQPCFAATGEYGSDGTSRFCAPLISKGQPIAQLHIDLLPTAVLSKDAAETLRRALPEMALTLANARLERFLSDQVAANFELATEERRRIAQDLHDTLAPNIGYVRLKLDQLTCDSTLHSVREIQKDLERMHDAATEAYEQIQRTIGILGPNSQTGLGEAIAETARHIGRRAGFEVAVKQQSVPFPLEPDVRRQLLFIFHEALNNVEKHAGATLVTIDIDWNHEGLVLSIVDNGSGFRAERAQKEGHFGLGIMRQRTESIGGELTIDSLMGAGTRVKLRVPGAPQRARGIGASDMSDGIDASV